MFTPRSKPSRLTRMKSVAGPWNHVAIMKPSSCQTVANRSQSPASRHTTQFSTSSRISARSSLMRAPHACTSCTNIGTWLVGGIGGPGGLPLRSGVP